MPRVLAIPLLLQLPANGSEKATQGVPSTWVLVTQIGNVGLTQTGLLWSLGKWQTSGSKFIFSLPSLFLSSNMSYSSDKRQKKMRLYKKIIIKQIFAHLDLLEMPCLGSATSLCPLLSKSPSLGSTCICQFWAFTPWFSRPAAHRVLGFAARLHSGH